MPNGYIVGHILDMNTPHTSTLAKVEILKGSTKIRTLYPIKVATADYWYYSTAIAPYDSYTVKAFDTSVAYAYKPLPANVPNSAPVTVDFDSRDPHALAGHVVDPYHKPVVAFVDAVDALFQAAILDPKIKGAQVAVEIDEK